MAVRLATILTSLLICSGMLTSAEANVSSPHKHYSSHGIHFDYPDNWVITSEQVSPSEDSHLSIIIEGPDQSLAIIETTPEASSLRDFAQVFSRGVVKTVTAGRARVQEVKPALDEISSTKIKERLTVSADKNTRTVFSITYRMIKGSKKTAYLITQSCREDQESTRPGFEMIDRSLKIDPGSE